MLERDRAAVQLNLLLSVAGFAEEIVEECANQGRIDRVKLVLAVAPAGDQLARPQQRQVMADGRLHLSQNLAKGRHMLFAVAAQGQQYLETRGVGQHLEKLGQTTKRRVRHGLGGAGSLDGRVRTARPIQNA